MAELQPQPIAQTTTFEQPSVSQLNNPNYYSAFQVNPQQVYSTANITQTSASPTPRPDDLLGIRQQIANELNIPGLSQDYQSTLAQLNQAQATSRNQQTAIENLPQALNVIRGEQAQAQRLSANTLQSLAEAASVKQSALQAANMELAARYGIREQEVNYKRELIVNYPGAKIKFGDSIEKVAKKLVKYQEEAKKEVYKDSLKQQLLAMGRSTKGSTRELEKKLKKLNRGAREAAQEEAKLKTEALKLDIANTKSQIANRGSEDKLNPIYTIGQDGKVTQATDANGQPVMVPSGAVIRETGQNDNQNPVYFTDPMTGDISQAMNDDGTPLMLPKGSIIKEGGIDGGFDEEEPSSKSWWQFWK